MLRPQLPSQTGARNALLLAAVLASAPAMQPARADTFYVRVDGGDASQCTGRDDAPYPGSGTAQACAWNHPFHALAPDGTRRIDGGDTLRIGSGSYMIGQGAPGAGACLPANCSLGTVPSGNGNATTRVLGDATNPPKLWGTLGVTRILSLDGSSNVEIGHLEITDQHDCIYNHSNASVKCPAVGTGAWAKHGLYARASSNVWLHDLDIHGLGHTGLWAGGLTNWTIERVRLHRNGRAGWDANTGTPSSNAGAIVLRHMEIAWNGCGERWQTGEAWACWAQQAGGYGDGLGTVATGGQWLIEDTFVHHNTQDGLDLRFLDGANSTHATLRRIHAVGNAGNQVKVKGNSLIENSVLIGNCGYFSGKFYMLAADHCRADGTTLLLVFTPNDLAVVRHNTITGEGWSLIGATEGDTSGRATVQNNVLAGFPWFLNPADLSRVQAGTSPALVTHTGNLVWNVYANVCPGDSLCGLAPRLANMALASFDAEPLSDSPVIDRVAPMAEVSSDFVLRPRPSGAASDIGAYEMPAADTCARAAPTLALSGPSAEVPAGAAVDYTLTLTNHDGSSCTSTVFNLARSVPAGWLGALGITTLSLAPGDVGNTTLTVTSSANAAPGGYAISVGASSSAGAVHTASATAPYTVETPIPVCTRAAPSMSLEGPTAAVPAGTGVEYTVGLVNNDSSVCDTTSFDLAESVPAGWSGTLATTALDLAPGANGSTTLTVASPLEADPGPYGIGAGVGSSVGAEHTASASITYTVHAPPPPCVRGTPTIGITGPTAAVQAGTAVAYTVSVGNQDSSTCDGTSFSLADTVPAGWSGTLAATTLTLAPGAGTSTTLTVTSPVDATEGAYGFGVGIGSGVGVEHTASDSGTYFVDAPPPPCTRATPTIGISGPGIAVQAGAAVVYTISLTNHDSSTCATSDFSLAQSVPAGWSGTLATSTIALAPGANGSTTLTVTSAVDAVEGDYPIGAGVGSSVGAQHTASASATYSVDAPPPPCTRATPGLSLSGPTAAVPAGTAVTYTLDVVNHDSATCASTSFNLAHSVPSGWNGTLGAASLSLAPGASGSTTFTVTSAGNATEGSYTIGASTTSSVGAEHAASTSATYTVDVPPVCTRAAPTISLTGSGTAVAAGTAVAYTLSVSNHDSQACATTSFNLARTVPAGWTGTLDTGSLSLAPGTSGTTTLTVTSASGTTAGNYSVDASVGSSVGAVHAASTSITYAVAALPCTRAAPAVSVTGPGAAVAAGTAVDYTVSVANGDSATCATTSFNLARTVPAGWTGTLTATALSLAPGASGSTTLRVTSSGTAAAGSYPISAGTSSSVGAVHSASASANYTVAAPVVALTTTLTTDRATYARRDTVQIAALLRNNGVAVPGAVVTFTLARPGNGTTTLTATSAADGFARTTYKVPNAKSALGSYTLTARWSLGGVTAQAVTTFVVQ